MADDDNVTEWSGQILMAELDSIDPLQDTVEEMLVEGRFRDLEALAIGQGMSADDIRQAVKVCGRTLCAWPIDRALSPTRSFTQRGRPKDFWTRTFPMWTVEDQQPVVWITFTVSELGDGNRSVAIEGVDLKDYE